jgi:hypothetical protein
VKSSDINVIDNSIGIRHHFSQTSSSLVSEKFLNINRTCSPVNPYKSETDKTPVFDTKMSSFSYNKEMLDCELE